MVNRRFLNQGLPSSRSLVLNRKLILKNDFTS